jgi:N-acetylneuraminic acid mutarotase
MRGPHWWISAFTGLAVSCGGSDGSSARDCVPSPEACDGIDNDCDGTIDNEPQASQACEDQNACTRDVCSIGRCLHVPSGQCDRWQPVADLGAPSVRYRHSAIWTGARMIVFGGTAGTALETYKDGGSYDPVADQWTPISAVNDRYFRERHTAVWTGTDMLVFGGGETLEPYFNDGRRYNASSDTWSAIPELPYVSYGRVLHTAVWTGSEMVIWGGKASAFDWTYTGGVYDPSTDSWRPVAAANVPAARAWHTAVWTGNRMIVWGGGSDVETLNSGGVYDPIGDTWQPTSLVGAPPPAQDHTAVWTGSVMIVWGGYNDTAASLASGGIYDPASDTWQLLPTAGAPSSRSCHAAVWTGTEMVVWGGFSDSANLRDGGAYSPATNEWRGVSDIGAPAGRGYPTAVWTGDRMVVWGGWDMLSTEFLAAGGAYQP